MPSSHRRRPVRVTAAPAANAETTSLRMPLKPERLTALLHAHHRLLDKIKLKRRELQRLAERVQSTMTAASSRLQPVTAEIAQLDGELHTLFAELLGNRRLSRSASAAIKDLYRTLQHSGMMSPQPSAAPRRAVRPKKKTPALPKKVRRRRRLRKIMQRPRGDPEITRPISRCGRCFAASLRRCIRTRCSSKRKSCGVPKR